MKKVILKNDDVLNIKKKLSNSSILSSVLDNSAESADYSASGFSRLAGFSKTISSTQ